MRSILFLVALAAPALSWHAAGHMLVAQVAYKDLQASSPDIMPEIDKVMAALTPYSKDGNHRFIETSEWADDIKEISWLAFNDWHFYDHYIVRNITPPQDLPQNPTNIVWALKQCMETLKSKRDGKFDKLISQSFMLRFLFHLTGDIHQPLHNASLVSPDFPHGDKGGNEFHIHAKGFSNLHSFWDAVLGTIDEVGAPLDEKAYEYIDGWAKDLMAAYPRSHFNNELNEKDFGKWSDAMEKDADTLVYDGISPNDSPSASYVSRGVARCKELITLAGYRLSNLLIEIYKSGVEL